MSLMKFNGSKPLVNVFSAYVGAVTSFILRETVEISMYLKMKTYYKLIILFAISLTATSQAYAAADGIADPNQVFRQNTFGAHRETVEDIQVKVLALP